MRLRTILAGDLDPQAALGLLTGGVGPRPIALASTISEGGCRNLAPFSFFNAFGSNPPMVGFAPNRRGRDGTLKDTYRNALVTKAFVIAAVSFAMVQQMNIASAEYPESVDEFEKSGLTPLPATLVRPALVGESPFQMECRLHQTLELGTGPGSGLLLVGEVLAFHVREDCFRDGLLHPGLLDLVGRNGGSFYTRASGAALFELPKPAVRPLGLDELPGVLRASRILTANDLGRLASAEAVPGGPPVRLPSDPEAPDGLERAIHLALEEDDLLEAWRLGGVRVALG